MKMEAKEGREGKRMESWLWCAVRISLVSDSLKFEKKCAIASRVPLPGTEHSLQKRPVTVLNYIGKGKGAIPQLGRRRGAHFSSLGLWARGWINHLSPWRMASATPDLRLPSQPQSVTALWLVPNYTAWWQRQICVNNYTGGDLNLTGPCSKDKCGTPHKSDISNVQNSAWIQGYNCAQFCR